MKSTNFMFGRLDAWRDAHKTAYDVIELVAIVAVAWFAYQGLASVLQTPMPMVSVVSGSMEPVLHVGDLMIISRADYQADDIAIYLRGKITIIHRIIEIKDNGYFVFKGDHNPARDPDDVAPSQVLGKVRLAVPLLGFPRLVLYAFGI